MKVIQNLPQTSQKSAASRSPSAARSFQHRAQRGFARRERPEISESQIRRKVQAHRAGQQQAAKGKEQAGRGEKSSQAPKSAKEAKAQAEGTKEKLRQALQNGNSPFSLKERDVLNQIINR